MFSLSKHISAKARLMGNIIDLLVRNIEVRNLEPNSVGRSSRVEYLWEYKQYGKLYYRPHRFANSEVKFARNAAEWPIKRGVLTTPRCNVLPSSVTWQGRKSVRHERHYEKKSPHYFLLKFGPLFFNFVKLYKRITFFWRNKTKKNHKKITDTIC